MFVENNAYQIKHNVGFPHVTLNLDSDRTFNVDTFVISWYFEEGAVGDNVYVNNRTDYR